MTRNRSDTTTIDEAMTRFNYTQQRRDRLYWLYVSDLSGRLYTANQTTWLVLWPRRGAL